MKKNSFAHGTYLWITHFQMVPLYLSNLPLINNYFLYSWFKFLNDSLRYDLVDLTKEALRLIFNKHYIQLVNSFNEKELISFK